MVATLVGSEAPPEGGTNTDTTRAPELATSGAPATETASAEPHWYGWQTLVADGAGVTMALGLGIPALTAEQTGLLFVAPVGVALGPPIVHWAHGQLGAGFLSLGMRAASAGIPAVIAAAGQGSGEFDAAFPAILTGVVLYVVTVIVDAAVLAYER